MRWHGWHGVLISLTVAAATAAGILAARAASPSESESAVVSVVRGGRLYDNWYREIGRKPPRNSHPAYPVDKTYANVPDRNWRCVECHGWDYRGKDGAYARGEHYTGIKGIRGMVGADPDRIVAILRETPHGYGEVLGRDDLIDLANFVSKGQVDMDALIDRDVKRAKGDAARHSAYYHTICATCHGSFGQQIVTARPIGDMARDDPWQALHNMLNGHAGDTMPALRAFGTETLVNLLAFVQTLPPRESLSSVVRGGRLYDNWYREVRKPPPKGVHPAWPMGAKVRPVEPRYTWRCKECHGWDYMGKDGAFGQGEHFTGIRGIRALVGAAPERVIAILKDRTHQFEDLMDERDLRDLANFVSRGQVDMHEYIDRATGKAKGDAGKRADHYLTVCASCHGADGRQIRTMPPLGRVAREDPWAALHKMLNGHPDEYMPALRALDRQTLADILAHVQRLPDRK
jgi:cytochrome c553